MVAYMSFMLPCLLVKITYKYRTLYPSASVECPGVCMGDSTITQYFYFVSGLGLWISHTTDSMFLGTAPEKEESAGGT